MHLLLLLLTSAAVPAVSAGPELEASARALAAPVAAVTVFSDRARLERRATLTLAKGVTTVALPDLPGATRLDSIRVNVSLGKVIRVETRLVEEARMTLPEVDALIAKVENLADAQAMLDARVAVANRELGFLASVNPAAPVAETERFGKGPLPVKPAVWKASLGFLDARRAALHQSLREEEIARRALTKKIMALQQEIRRHDPGASSQRRLKIIAILESAKKGKATLALRYDVPGARWWPTYELHFEPRAARVKLAYAGLLSQSTGESWREVALSLSTAIPGQRIAVPELLTWTLGEQREMIPQPRPERSLPRPVALSVPPARPSAAIIDRRIARAVLAARLQRLRIISQMSPSSLAGQAGAAAYASVGTGRGQYKPGKGQVSSYGLLASPPPQASRGAPARRRFKRPAPVSSAARMEAAPMMEMAADEPMDYGDSVSSVSTRSRGKKRAAGRRASVALYDPNVWRRTTYADRTLPAMLAGGFDYVFKAPTPATLESGAERLKVPLSVATWKAELLYEATPAIQKTAYLVARVKNATKKPILAGKMSIFVEGDFAGEGKLDTTGPGGVLTLPLGADEDIRLERHVAPATRVEGLVSKDEITDYAVHIEVGNYKKRSVTVDIFDVLPKTNNEDLEVKLLKATPKVSKGPDKRGRLRWRLLLKPGQTATIDFTYAIRRPKDWQLTQR